MFKRIVTGRADSVSIIRGAEDIVLEFYLFARGSMCHGEPLWWQDRLYFYYEGDEILKVEGFGRVPKDRKVFSSLYDTIQVANLARVWGRDMQKPDPSWPKENQRLYWYILNYGIGRYGEFFPVLYQGIRGPAAGHRYLFATPDRHVAERYSRGQGVVEHRNVRGLWYWSQKSVIEGREHDPVVIFQASSD